MHKTLSPLLAAIMAAGLLASMSAGAADVNPFTGTDASIAGLKRQLEIARLEAQIATEKANMRRVGKEEKAPADLKNPLAQFGTLKYPTDKMADPAAMFFPGMKGTKGKYLVPSLAPVAPVAAPAPTPVVPAGPRLVGIISDDAGRVAIIEQGGVLKQAKEGDSAHGQKVAKIGAGWAEVGGRRLTQDNSTLALVTNVDKQPVVRVAVAGGANTAPSPMGQPAAQITPFVPPGFQ